MSELPPCIDGTLNPSFAFASITERWPKIVTKIVDQLHQYYPEAMNQFGEAGGADVKSIISQIAELRYRIATDKPLTEIAGDEEDVQIWNRQLYLHQKRVGAENATWFKLPWLFTECFMYRKLHEFFLATTHLKNYDPFAIEKQRSYREGIVHMIALCTELIQDVEKQLSAKETRNIFLRLLQVSLWGNKCDLSLSGGDPHNMSATIFQELDELRQFVLVDDLDKVCDFFLRRKLNRVDIILDNAGLEVFTDLCLADLIVAKDLANEVVFYGKAFPWYVSDTTLDDFNWVIGQLASSEDEFLRRVGNRWHQFTLEGRFKFKTHPFFTFCFPYCDMKEQTPDLYADLSKSDFLIFKGDLNYRKLIGDRRWPYTTPFKTALRGFEPTSFVSLRTLKAETVAGLPQEKVQLMEDRFGKNNTQWMVTGDYAIVQMFLKPSAPQTSST